MVAITVFPESKAIQLACILSVSVPLTVKYEFYTLAVS